MKKTTPSFNAPDFFKQLKEDETLIEFCKVAKTSSENFRQIVFYRGSISRKLATRLSDNSAKFNGGQTIVASEFLFPPQSST